MAQPSRPALDDKKRLRDRKSQQAMRDRRKNYVNQLEEKLLACERDHKPDTITNLIATISSLRHENEVLKAQQLQIQSLVSSWAPTSTQLDVQQPNIGIGAHYHHTNRIDSSGGSSAKSNTCDQMRQPRLSRQIEEFPNVPMRDEIFSLDDSMEFPFLDLLDLDASHCQGPETENTALTKSLQSEVLSQYPWQYLPLSQSLSNTAEIKSKSLDWLCYPDIVASCSPTPAALDLLYSTGQNFLANSIAKRSRKRSMDIERLGFGWIVYVYCKWLVSPSPETFEHIPKFLWPVESQLQITHSTAIDLIVWPQLRDSIIKKLSEYQIEDVLELISRCLKVRWDTKEDPLEPGPDGTLTIRAQFLDVITSEDGWTLSSEFVNRYPALSSELPSGAILVSAQS